MAATLASLAGGASSSAPSSSRRRGDVAASAGSSWLSDLQAYERVRRKEIDVNLLTAPKKTITNSQIAHAERSFDTITQQFRDDSREAKQRSFEDQERMKHLNRARDVQIRREKRDFDIVTHEGRLDPLLQPHERLDLSRPQAQKNNEANPRMPGTYVDYNILSNVPFDEHHWAPPEQRPRAQHKSPKQRLVPVNHIKEFHIISNRYLGHHEEKSFRDKELAVVESAEKFRRQNRFDPVLQQLTDPRMEANVRAVEDARIVEDVLYAQAKQPPSYQMREAQGFDLISHEVKEPELINMLDAANAGRTSRYKTKHRVDRETRQNAAEMQDADALQRHTQISHERFLETTRRGYDIVSNTTFGDGPKNKSLRQPHTTPQMEMWDKVKAHREYDDLPPPAFGESSFADATAEVLRISLNETNGQIGSTSSRHRTNSRQPCDAQAGASGALTSRTSRRQKHGDEGLAALDSRRGVGSDHTGGALSARGPGPMRQSLGPPSGGGRGAEQVRTPAAAPQQHMAPPAPAVPGSSGGSVYSRPK